MDAGILAELDELNRTLSEDIDGDRANSMLSYFDTVRRSSEARSKLPFLTPADRTFLRNLIEGFDAARRVVQCVWEHRHSHELAVVPVERERQRVLRHVTRQQHEAYAAVYRNLMAVGLLAALYGLSVDSKTIHDAVDPTLSSPSSYRALRAMALAMAGDSSHACEWADMRECAGVDDDMDRVIKGCAQKLAHDSEWRFTIENVLATSSDQQVRAAARRILDDALGDTLPDVGTRRAQAPRPLHQL